MLIDVKVNNKKFKLDNFAVSKLNLFKERRDKMWDNVFIIDGMERGGKSSGILFPFGYYLTGRKPIIVFSHDEFNKAYDNADPNTPTFIGWDEFVMGGASSDWYDKMQQLLIKKLTTGAKKRVYIGLVIPSVFMLKGYFAVHRSIALIHCESSNLIDRDRYFWLGYSAKRYYYYKYKKYQGCTYKQMLELCKQFGNGICQFPVAQEWEGNKKGSITFYPENYFIDEEDYQRRKDQLIENITSEAKNPILLWRTRWLKLCLYLEKTLQGKEVALLSGLKPNTYYKLKKTYESDLYEE